MRRFYSALKRSTRDPKPIISNQPSGNTERLSDYNQTGLYPIKLDEVLNGRYQVLRKLGHGRYATVWLARDQSLSNYTALKISIPIDVNPDPELTVLSKLNKGVASNLPTNFPVPKLLDAFNLERFDSRHTVLVLEPLGATLRQIIDHIEDHDMYGIENRPGEVLRGLVRQMVEAVNFVHSRQVVHRDIQLKNFQLRLRQSPSLAAEHLLDRPATILLPSSFGLNHFGKYGPPYIVEPELLENAISTAILPSDLRLLLSDFGAATNFENANDGYHTYPLDVRSPEQLLGIPISEKSDIWALGCTIFHFVTLRHMFNINGYASAEKRDDQHLQGIIEVLGLELPEYMLQKWVRRESFVDDQGSLLMTRLEKPLNQPLSDQIFEDKPEGMSDLEAARFEEFIRSIMRLDPHQRPAAEEILKHPWLASEIHPE